MDRSKFIKIIALLCFCQNFSGYCTEMGFDANKVYNAAFSPGGQQNIGKYYMERFKYYSNVRSIPESKEEYEESIFDILDNNSTDTSSSDNEKTSEILGNGNKMYVKKILHSSRLKNFPLLSKWETTGSISYPRNSGNNNGFKETIYHNVDYFKKAMEHIANAYKCSRKIVDNLMAKNIKKQNIRDFKSNLSRSVLMSSILQCFFNDTKMFFYLRNDVFNISLFTDNDLRNAIKISIPACIFPKHEAALLGTNFKYEGKVNRNYIICRSLGVSYSEFSSLLKKAARFNTSRYEMFLSKFKLTIEKFINQNINNKYINNYANQGMKNKLIRAIVIKTIIEHLFDSYIVVPFPECGYTQFILTTGLNHNHMDDIYVKFPDRAFPSSSLYQCCVPSWKM